MTRSDRLADADRASLDAILAASAELAAVAAIMNDRPRHWRARSPLLRHRPSR
jgi:hypothetical protein